MVETLAMVLFGLLLVGALAAWSGAKSDEPPHSDIPEDPE